MGVVYEARQISLNRRVALKVLPLAAAMDPRQLQRFQVEAQAAACLHHTNIVPIHAVGCERGVHYYAMQFIEGQTLAAIIAELRVLAGLDEAGRDDTKESLPTLASRLVSGELAPAEPSPSPPRGEGGPKGRMRGSVGRGSPDPAPPPDRRSPAASKPASESTVGRGSPDPAPPQDRRSPDTGKTSSESLSSTSTRSRAFFRTAVRLGIQAAEAIEHAHGLGVVHRDIKPANLLIDNRSNLWITDFGLARLQSDSGLTLTGDLMGTLRYMSPEQAMGRGVIVDHRTDIYSLGVTLYELLTLRPVCPGDDRQTVLRQIAEDEPIAPRRHNPAIPRELETIVLKAIAKEPGSRYATAQELGDDLRRFLENKPIRAKRPSLLERAAKWGRRNTAIVAATIAILIVTVLALAGGVVQQRWARVRISAELKRALNAEEATRREQAKTEKAVAQARAINEFLTDHLLAVPRPESLGRQVTMRDALEKAVPEIEQAFAGQPEVEAAVRLTVGQTYRSLGSYPQAEPHLRRALELRRECLGPDHPDTLSAVTELALLLHYDGKLEEAESLMRRNVEARHRVSGSDHPNTLIAVNNLAILLRDRGKLAEAEPLLRENVVARRRILGPDHPDTLTAVTNLGDLLQAQGKWAEAEPLLRQNLEAHRRVQGPDHPHTLTAVNNLAVLLGYQSKLAEAEPLLRENVVAHRRVSGADHPDTLNAEHNLGCLLRDQGKWAEAEPLLRQNLEAQRRVLGPDHPSTLGSVDDLASLLRNRGKLAEAEPLFRQNLEAYRRVLGPDHPETLIARNHLALLLAIQGKRAEAEPLLRENLEARRRVLGPDHPSTLNALHNLAGLLKDQDKLPEAEPLLREALRGQRKALGAAHPGLAATLGLLGWVLTERGQAQEAESLLRECLEIFQRALPQDAWQTANARSWLGRCLLAQKKYAEAEALLLEGYQGLTRAPGTPPGRVEEARDRLVKFYEEWGKPKEAQAWKTKPDPVTRANGKEAR
jgi:tetratricopeptide (TPR) repeat protein